MSVWWDISGVAAAGYEIYAPVVISDAGVANTFSKLLPAEVAKKSRQLVKNLPVFSIFASQCVIVSLQDTAACSKRSACLRAVVSCS